jgi:hypothetical protein
MKTPSLFQSAVALGLAGTIAIKVVHHWYRNWGATSEEIARPMPLDERIPDPDLTTTRAVTIRSCPEQVWPWIVQMGEPPRAGFYSYTWIEKMQGLNIENSEQILPDHQTLNVGESVDKEGNMVVLGIEPGYYVALGPPADCDWLQSTWVIALYPLGADSTRLVTRLRGRMSFRRMLRALPPTVWPFWLVIEPGIFVMERKMLLEIRRLAERSAGADTVGHHRPTSGAPTEDKILIHRPVEGAFEVLADAQAAPG